MNLAKRGKIINALDVGSGNIRVITGQTKGQDFDLHILGVGQVRSNGLRKGVVVDIEETSRAITEAKEKAEQASGLPIEHAYVALEGVHIAARPSKGTVAISRADGEVSEDDVQRAVSAAQAISLPLNREIIRVIPRTFTIDGQNHIKYPVGMSGVRLEVDTLILGGSSPIMKNLIKCVNQAGIDINELILAPLAASHAVLTKQQKELGVVLIDIGTGTTGLVVFEEGDLLHAAILPIGSGHITNDIAIGLKTSIDVAEKVKLEYHKKNQLDLSKISGDEEGIILKQKIHSIVEARLAEIFSMINKELKKLDRQKLLPAGAVLVGGGAKMQNIIDLAKRYLDLPVQLGLPSGLEGVTDEVIDPSFATAIGLLTCGLEQDNQKQKTYLPAISPALNKVKKWLRTFLP